MGADEVAEDVTVACNNCAISKSRSNGFWSSSSPPLLLLLVVMLVVLALLVLVVVLVLVLLLGLFRSVVSRESLSLGRSSLAWQASMDASISPQASGPSPSTSKSSSSGNSIVGLETPIPPLGEVSVPGYDMVTSSPYV